MRRLFLIGILCLTGCQNVLGPFAPRKPERVDDPLLSITEQQRRGRDRLALPEDASTTSPRISVQPPEAGPWGIPVP